MYGAYVARHADEIPGFEFYPLTVATQLAVYNGVVLAWREKVTLTVLLLPLLVFFLCISTAVPTIMAIYILSLIHI